MNHETRHVQCTATRAGAARGCSPAGRRRSPRRGRIAAIATFLVITGAAFAGPASASTYWARDAVASSQYGSGGSLCGILYAVLVGTETIDPFLRLGNLVPALHSAGPVGQLASHGAKKPERWVAWAADAG